MDFEFFNKLIDNIRSSTNKEIFTVGEYWSPVVNVLKKYIEDTNHAFNILDVPLHYNFVSAANEKENYDLRGL